VGFFRTNGGSPVKSITANGSSAWTNDRWITGPGPWSWSASAWFKPTSSGNLLDCISSTAFPYYNTTAVFQLAAITVAADRKLSFSAAVSVIPGSYEETNGPVPVQKTVASAAGLVTLGSWAHVAVACDSDAKQIALYFNGSLVGTAAFPTQTLVGFGSTVTAILNTVPQVRTPTVIQAAPWSLLSTALGGAAEFAFYPRQVLTAAECRSLASGANPTRIPPFVSLYAPLIDGLSSTRSDHPPVAVPAASATVFSFRPPSTIRASASSSVRVTPQVSSSLRLSANVSATSSITIIPQSSSRKLAIASASTPITIKPYANPGPAWPVVAVSQMRFGVLASAGFTRLAAATSSFTISTTPTSASGRSKQVSGSSSIIVTPSIPMARVPIQVPASAATSVVVADGADASVSNVQVDALSSIVLTPTSGIDSIINTFVFAHASSRIRVRPRARQADLDLSSEVWSVSTLEIDSVAIASVAHKFHRIARSQVTLTGEADTFSAGTASASSGVSISSVATAGRSISVAATTSMSLSGPSESNDLPFVTSESTVLVTGSASQEVDKLGGRHTLVFRSRADVTVELPGGVVVPGGDSSPGPRALLWDGVSSEFPLHFAESPDGTVLMANGVGPMIAWDGLSSSAWPAGLAAPASPVVMTTEAYGQMSLCSGPPIVGRYAAFQRFLDDRGNPSNLSPPGTLIVAGRDGWIARAESSASGLVTIHAPQHGLSSGDHVYLSGVSGLPIDGCRTVGTATEGTFTLADTVATSGVHLGGGTWSTGASKLVYRAAAPTDPKVVRRQILRNLDGDFHAFWVDVDTTDLTSETFESSLTDFEISFAEPVPLSDDRGFPHASRHAVPPSHKLALCAHQGRIFAAGEVAVTSGHAEVSLWSPVVRGVGTSWTPSLAGRMFCHVAAGQQFEIASVESPTQLTLNRPYDGPSSVFALYSIQPPASERRLVYYSEPNRPESWPTWNAFAVPETNDEIVGLVAIRSSLFIVEKRTTHRLTFKDDPARDGMVFPRSGRGCVNHRCIVIADGMAYMLDESGVHAFDGEESSHLSDPVQSMFQSDPSSELRIDWSADRSLWHAVLDQTRGIIRWFVSLSGRTGLADAICFSYRANRWWVESYAEPITSSCAGTVGYRRALAGTTSRRVVVLGEGTLDAVPDGAGVTSGVVLAQSDGTHIELSGGGLPVDLSGVPVCVVSGRASGQTSVICDSTDSTFDVVTPFDPPPETGDEIQVGGIPFQWRSGWFRYAPDESENPRDVELVFQPTDTPQSIETMIYIDHSTIPVPWGLSRYDTDTAVVGDTPKLIARMDSKRGHITHRITGHSDPYASGDRYVSVELAGVQGVSPVRVFQITLSGCGQ
jgi:hypothetical protein